MVRVAWAFFMYVFFTPSGALAYEMGSGGQTTWVPEARRTKLRDPKVDSIAVFLFKKFRITHIVEAGLLFSLFVNRETAMLLPEMASNIVFVFVLTVKEAGASNTGKDP